MRTLYKKKISVIIVNYNNAKFLSESINSVLNQKLNNLEIIVIDDRSTDNSIQVLNKYKKKVTIIKNKKKTKFGSFNQINSYYKGFLNHKVNTYFFWIVMIFLKKIKSLQLLKNLIHKKI